VGVGIEYRIVCHRCKVRMELGKSNPDVGNLSDFSCRVMNALSDFLRTLDDVDLDYRQDRYILWGRTVELRKALMGVAWPGSTLRQVVRVAFFIREHARHLDEVEIVSDADEDAYGATDSYEEVI